MKRPNAHEICRWLMDDTLVMQGIGELTGSWVTTKNPTAWDVIRVSITTVEGTPLFRGDVYYNEYGQERTAHIGLTDSWDKCTLTPPKHKSILDSEEFEKLMCLPREALCVRSNIQILKQFLRDHKDEI